MSLRFFNIILPSCILHVRVLEMLKNAELFARKRCSGITVMDGKTPYSKHLEDVVNRLKSLGVIDEDVLCSGWLHAIMNQTDTSFDDLYEQFGSRIAVLVSDLTQDMSLPRKKREQVYVKQLVKSSFDAKLVKLCGISADLSDLKNCDASKSKKLRITRLKRRYLLAIKDDLLKNTSYPKVQTLLAVTERTLGKRV